MDGVSPIPYYKLQSANVVIHHATREGTRRFAHADCTERRKYKDFAEII